MKVLPLKGCTIMNRLHFMLVCLLWIVTNSSNAGYEWKYANVEPTGYSIHAFYFTDTLNGWISSGYGELFNTEDGGSNWKRMVLPRPGVVRGIFFLNRDTGWCLLDTIKKDSFYVANFSHFLMCTKNRGKSWQLRPLPDSCWGGLFFVNTEVGWIGGYQYRTADGGKTWKSLKNPSIGRYDFLTGYWFTDSIHGFVCTNNSGWLFKSDDGGMSWDPRIKTQNCCSDDICFTDKKYGWCCKIRDVYATKDSGNTWTTQSVYDCHDPSFQFRSLSCVDSLNGWVAGDIDGHGSIYRTTDNTIWHLQGEIPFSPEQMRFVSKSTGWAGRIYYRDVEYYPLYKTTDSGFTWNDIATYKYKDGNFKAVNITRSGTWYAGGQNGVMYCSKDSGRTWASVVSGTNRSINIIDFKGNLGCAICDSATVLITINGGVSWKPVSCGDGHLLRSMAINNSSIWVLRDTGIVYRSNDSGRTWNPLNFAAGNPLKKVIFTSKDTGFIFCGYKYLYKTVDGGNSWKCITPTVTGSYFFDFVDCSFYNSYYGYAIWENKLYGTPDGGLGWTLVMPKISFCDSIHKIYFKNVDTGYFYSKSAGCIYRTNDGCQTVHWEIRNDIRSRHFRDVSFTPDFRFGCVVGDTGTIAYFHDNSANDPVQVLTGKSASLNTPVKLHCSLRSNGLILRQAIDEDLEIRIVNLKGNTVLSNKINRNQTYLPISNLSRIPSGVYILKLQGKSILFTDRLLFKRL